MPTHSILGGKVNLYRRDDGGDNWFCSTFIDGKNRRKSTKTDSLSHAEEIAEDWFLELRGKSRAGLLDLPTGKTFNQAADTFEVEYQLANAEDRSSRWIAEHIRHLSNHLRPFFGKMPVSEITNDTAEAYRLHRAAQPAFRGGTAESRAALASKEQVAKRPSRSTIKNELITARLVLQLCERKGWVKVAPPLKEAYRGKSKIEHRPWFSPDEYKAFYLKARENARKPQRADDKWYAEQLYDFILFMSNTGLRPDEANQLEHRDVQMVKDSETGELILEIEVNRGKRGHGFCKSRSDAVKVYQRLLNRPRWVPKGRSPKTKKAKIAAAALPPAPVILPTPSDLMFPGNRLKLFNKILNEAGLKFDRGGKARTAYSLRHTYICNRLSEGADIYQLAKNCRTSVEMIQKFYAPHIKTMISAGAVNAKRPRRHRANETIRAD